MWEFITGSMVALLAASLGYGAAKMQQIKESRRQRRALASAFLIELRRLESSLRGLYDDEQAADNSAPTDSTVFDRAGEDIYIFDDETVRALSNFYGLLEELLALFAYKEEGKAVVTDSFHHRVRSLAGLSANSIGPAKSKLEEAGGRLPPDIEAEIAVSPDLPELKPASFDGSDFMRTVKIDAGEFRGA